MVERQKFKDQRKRLWLRQKKHCFWCGVETQLPTGAGPTSPTTATMDHLDDRYSPQRGQRAGEFRRVVACAKCNHERGRESDLKVPVEERQRRSGRFPQLAALGDVWPKGAESE